MDKTIPLAAVGILRLISFTETGRNAPQCYEVVYGHNEDKLAKPLTQMTIDEIVTNGMERTRLFGSSAAGAYQFMKGTLRDLVKKLGLTGQELLTGDLQDRLGFELLKLRGYEKFIAGDISIVTFGNNLAKEWASFPVLWGIQGAHRRLSRGETYYAGDKLNKVLLAPEAVETALKDALTIAKLGGVTNPAPAPIPAPKPVTPTPSQPVDPVAPAPAAVGFFTALINFILALFSRKAK